VTSRTAPAPTADAGPSSVRRRRLERLAKSRGPRPARHRRRGPATRSRSEADPRALCAPVQRSSADPGRRATASTDTAASASTRATRAARARRGRRPHRVRNTARSDVAKRTANARAKQQSGTNAERIQNARKNSPTTRLAARTPRADNPKARAHFDQAGQIIANYTNAGLASAWRRTAGCMTAYWNNPCYWNGWYGNCSSNWCCGGTAAGRTAAGAGGPTPGTGAVGGS
jgi:hypothetical protein